jgi:hypothetical protein
MTRTATVKWNKSYSGEFAYVRSCKVVKLASGGFLVERVDSALMPTSTIGWFATIENALASTASEPEPTCQRCGKTVVPGYQIPDPSLPCPRK